MGGKKNPNMSLNNYNVVPCHTSWSIASFLMTLVCFQQSTLGKYKIATFHSAIHKFPLLEFSD